MKLCDLHIHYLRNIQNRRFPLGPHLNFILGPNGAGKTSFLEGLYLVATGRSFRSREITHLITEGQSQLQIFAKSQDEQRFSLQKSLQQPMIAQINGQHCTSTSTLARLLPCQLLYQDIFNIIDAGPGIRRAVLDWGLFHVEPQYHQLLKDYRRALQQRNVLLRQRAPLAQFQPWNHLLSELSQQLDAKRSVYFRNLLPFFGEVLAALSDLNCTLRYFKGWDRKNEGKNLELILEQSMQSDLQRQFTQQGAHQADLLLIVEDKKAKYFLSRGQQKICLFALKLAQLRLLHENPIVLIDDLMSELDKHHIQSLLDYIAGIDSQFFITCQPEAYVKKTEANVIMLS